MTNLEQAIRGEADGLRLVAEEIAFEALSETNDTKRAFASGQVSGLQRSALLIDKFCDELFGHEQ